MIYADNAATTKMSEAAINAMTACMRDTWGNPSSLYGLGQRAKEALEDARERIATCIGASPKRQAHCRPLSNPPLRPQRRPGKPSPRQCQLLF